MPVRRQFNAITAFVDASNVYASEDESAHIIRTHLDGEMKVDHSNLLPIVDNEHKAGDVRAIENPALASVHTLWVREHNRFVDTREYQHKKIQVSSLYFAGLQGALEKDWRRN